MKHWWLVMALMLSLGVNAGLLLSRLIPEREASSARPLPETSVRGETPPHGDDPPPRAFPRIIERMADELHLEGERRERFVILQRQFLGRSRSAREKIQRHQGRLRHELTSGRPDRSGVENTLQELAAARSEMEEAFVVNVLETRELLDPEQARRFLRLMSRLRQSRERIERFSDARQRWQERRQAGPRRLGPPAEGPREETSPDE